MTALNDAERQGLAARLPSWFPSWGFLSAVIAIGGMQLLATMDSTVALPIPCAAADTRMRLPASRFVMIPSPEFGADYANESSAAQSGRSGASASMAGTVARWRSGRLLHRARIAFIRRHSGLAGGHAALFGADPMAYF